MSRGGPFNSLPPPFQQIAEHGYDGRSCTCAGSSSVVDDARSLISHLRCHGATAAGWAQAEPDDRTLLPTRLSDPDAVARGDGKTRRDNGRLALCRGSDHNLSGMLDGARQCQMGSPHPRLHSRALPSWAGHPPRILFARLPATRLISCGPRQHYRPAAAP